MPHIPSQAEVFDAERRADSLARRGASAVEIDAADAETDQLEQARLAGGSPNVATARVAAAILGVFAAAQALAWALSFVMGRSWQALPALDKGARCCRAGRGGGRAGAVGGAGVEDSHRRRSAMTGPCFVCPRPIDLSRRHVAITRTVESERRGVVTVHDAETTARMHVECAPSAQLTAAEELSGAVTS